MVKEGSTSLKDRLIEKRSQLTPKGRQLADFVSQNPRQAVFLRTRELAAASGVSEATVVRFVGRLGYRGYPEFIQALRDLVDAELSLVDRAEMAAPGASEDQRPGQVVADEINNLKKLYQCLDPDLIRAMGAEMLAAREIFVVGSRLSYTFAYYLGWSLTKLRPRVHILNGSDTVTIDRLSTTPEPALVVILTLSRYPNELIRLAKAVRRAGHRLIAITDGPLSPVLQFAHLSYVVPSRNFPVIGAPSAIHCFTNCLVSEMLSQGGAEVRRHQERLEKALMENDLLFNLE